MFCVKCGKQMADGSRFCIYCGAQAAGNRQIGTAISGKNKRTALVVIILGILLAVVIPLAVKHIIGGDPQKAILGKWEEVGDDSWLETMEFLSDGTMLQNGKRTKYSYPYIYEIIDGEQLKIGTYDAGWFTYDYDYYYYEFKGNKLVLTDVDDGYRYELKKVK